MVKIINPSISSKTLPKVEHNLNDQEIEIINLIVNCRNNGLFAEDLTKAKRKIKKYIQKFNYEK